MGEMEFVMRMSEAATGHLAGAITTPFGDVAIQSGSVDRDDSAVLAVATESFGKLKKRDLAAKQVGDEWRVDFSLLMPGVPDTQTLVRGLARRLCNAGEGRPTRVDDVTARSLADAMVDFGMRGAVYVYVDCNNGQRFEASPTMTVGITSTRGIK